MKNQVNRGKTCSSFGCISLARVKVVCNNCYHRNRVKRKIILKRLQL